MAKPVISILIPVYNAEKFIAQCLDSVVNQSFKDIEVIIADDGSTDSSGSILDDYSSKYDFIKVYHKENEGIVKTRSYLMRQATGKYIGWVDADDFIEETMFETMLNEAETTHSELVLCDYNFYPESISSKGKWYKPYKGVVDWHFVERNGVHWNKLVSKDLIDRIDMASRNEFCGEGSYALLFFFANGISSIDKPLYNYRVGHSSLSTSFDNYSWYILNVDKAKRFREIIDELNLSESWGEYYDAGILYAIIQVLITASYSRQKSAYQHYKIMYKEYKHNNLISQILDDDFGKMKSFVVRKVIPSNYSLARVVTKVALK